MAEQVVLPAATESPRAARRFVGDALRSEGAAWAVEVAELLVSELVTNAVLHARGEVSLRVAHAPGRVRVEVAGQSGGMPMLLRRTTQATTGRGLVLVDALAAAWGVEDAGTGKAVWFELGDGASEVA